MASSISGTQNAEQLDYYQKLFNKFQGEIDEQRTRSREKDNERTERMEENYRTALRKQAADSDENLVAAKENLNRTLAGERETGKAETIKLKENYDRMGRFYATDGRDAKVLERQLAQEYENSKDVARLNNEKYKAVEESSRENSKAINQDAEAQTENLRASHREEVGKLREQLRDMTATDKQDAARKAEATTKDIRDNENAWLLKAQHLSSEQDRELNHLRSKAREIESYYASANAATLRDQEQGFTDTMKRQNTEHHNENKLARQEFAVQVKDLQKQRKLENEANDRSTRAQLKGAQEQQTLSMEKQSRSYQDLISRTRESQNAEVSALQRSLNLQQTSQDTLLIPPQVETNVRNAVIKEYEKQFDAEKDRNKRGADYQTKASTEKLQDVLREEQTKFTRANQQGEQTRASERKMALNHIHEIDFEKKAAIREHEIQSERANQTITREFGLSLDRQRRDYESMIENMRNDASVKLQAQRQEAEFNTRMKLRDLQARQSETVRQYEKRLVEQRGELNLQIEDLKQKTQNDLREAERRGKQSLEEQSRQYEQRIAQLESQHKERERYMESTFQEEVDRVRRANELFVKKKG